MADVVGFMDGFQRGDDSELGLGKWPKAPI